MYELLTSPSHVFPRENSQLPDIKTRRGTTSEVIK